MSVPIYSTNGNAVYNHRAWPGPQYTAQIDTKSAIYAQNWAVSYSEETSPVETFGLEQSTPCIPNNNALPSVHSQAYRWPQSTQRSFSEQENISQYVTKAEAMSPLNMASVSSALPVAAPVPGPQVSDHAIIAPRSDPSIIAPRLKLPMPHPSPAQSTRNMVDLLQDQRLRSSQMAPPTSLNANFAKPLSNWASDIPGTEVRSTSALMSSSTESAATSSSFTSVTNDASMAYVPLTAASNEINGAVTTTPPQLSFNTTPLLEAMPNPLSSTTYSNFRDYAQPISSSGDALSMFAPHSSRYSFSTENTKNLNEGALISGQPYTPLKTPADAQQTAKRENKQRQLTVVPSPN